MIESTASPWVLAIVFAFGTVLGSFLNVCIHRLPRGESIVRPRSRCPACAAPIPWQSNVPILSYVALMGRCAACRAPISWRYPFVEALSGVLLAWRFGVHGPTVEFAITSSFALALVVLFFTDLDHQLLPDRVTLPGFVVGMAISWWNPFLGEGDWRRVWMALSGAALGSGLLYSVGAVYERLRGIEAMGLGDVKMMAMVGAFAGPKGVVFTIFAASVSGAIVGLALIPLRGRSLQDALPFGCFLAPAAFAGLILGGWVVDRYLELLPPLGG